MSKIAIAANYSEMYFSLHAQYTLKAVINHSGSIRSGHYTPHIKQAYVGFL